MLTATIDTLTLAMAGSAPFWIVGWIVVLAFMIAVPIYYTRRRRNRTHRPPH